MVIKQSREVHLPRNNVDQGGAESHSEVRNCHPSHVASSSDTQVAVNKKSGLIRAGTLSGVCEAGWGGGTRELRVRLWH